LDDIAKSLLFRAILGQAIHGRAQVHRHGEKSLQQCVVEFPRHSLAFREPLFTKQIQVCAGITDGQVGEKHAKPTVIGCLSEVTRETRSIVSELRSPQAIEAHWRSPRDDRPSWRITSSLFSLLLSPGCFPSFYF
jgi:hypothetical protein